MSKTVLILILAAVAALASCMHTRSVTPESQDFHNVQMHQNCQGRDYCLEMSDLYPIKRIDYLLSKYTKFNLSRIDMGGVPEDRGVLDHAIVNPCEWDSILQPIYQIKDKNGKIRYVVQSKDKFEQIVRLEWCKNKGKISSNTVPFSNMSNDYEVSCEESYSNYRFLVLAFDGMGFESVRAGNESIPVCCRCEIHVKDKLKF